VMILAPVPAECRLIVLIVSYHLCVMWCIFDTRMWRVDTEQTLNSYRRLLMSYGSRFHAASQLSTTILLGMLIVQCGDLFGWCVCLIMLLICSVFTPICSANKCHVGKGIGLIENFDYW